MSVGRFVSMIGGFIATIVGWAIWQEPHLDWQILVSSLINEIQRLINDPFAILGLIIMFLGMATIIKASTPHKNE